MRFVSLQTGPSTPDSAPQLGMVVADKVRPLPREGGFPGTMIELISSFTTLRVALQQLESDSSPNLLDIPLADANLAAPIVNSEKLICIGKNYADHAREMGGSPPTIPVVFSKFASTLTAPGSPVVLPAISEQVDFEAELVVVIGKTGHRIDREQAMEFVFGYCCGNDISARDWQKGRPGGQWLLGKTFDTFAPLGPAIVTADEVGDPHDLEIELRLNGDVMQQANTCQLIFPIDFLIHHLSQFVTLQPGDLIFTGTPAGVGAGRTPPRFLRPGDRMEVTISGLGQLENPVQADQSN